jgi:branched-chain amino acid transport system permease protein
VIDDVVNGIAFGSLLFVLASGFTLALGVIRVVNIAHGAFYMLGVFVALEVSQATGSFPVAIAASGLALGALALATHEALLRTFSMQPLRQVLCTFGVTLIVAEAVRHIWGGYPKLMATPGFLEGNIRLGSTVSLPTYRGFVIVFAAALAVLLWLLMSRSRAGAVVRACIDDEEIAAANGVNVRRVFAVMFAFAGLLAGIGGAIGAPFIGSYQGVQFDMLTLTLVPVVIGGLGSIAGALIGSLLIGIINSVGTGLVPSLSYFLLFGPMILILAVRPTGLLGREE